MDPVHDRGSIDPVHESGPWTRSKVGVHGPLVHVLSSPTVNASSHSPTESSSTYIVGMELAWNHVAISLKP